MICNPGASLLRPVIRYFRTFEWMARGFLHGRDRILEHRFLACMQARRKLGITRRDRVVPNPKIHSAMSGEEHRIMSDEIVMDPGGRSSDQHSADKDGHAQAAQRSRAFPSKVDREQEKWNEQK